MIKFKYEIFLKLSKLYIILIIFVIIINVTSGYTKIDDDIFDKYDRFNLPQRKRASNPFNHNQLQDDHGNAKANDGYINNHGDHESHINGDRYDDMNKSYSHKNPNHNENSIPGRLNSKGKMKRIALCFLTYTDVSQPQIWNRFIQFGNHNHNNNSNVGNKKYNVYAHNKINITTHHSSEQEHFASKYIIYSKRKVPTTRYHISILKATVALFQAAFEDDEDNEYFVLLSDTDVPLYSSSEIYDKIVYEINDNMLTTSERHQSRFNSLKDKKFFSLKNYRKQHQWMILTRKTVKYFLNHDYIDSVFGNKAEVPDEHYFVNIMRKFNITYLNQQLTYVNWKEPSDDIKKYQVFPKTYDKLNDTMVHHIKKECPSCLIMRKVNVKCKLPPYFDRIKKEPV